ncbi:MAG: heptaprenyl diphosphate synthase component 1 [Lysinibacillus sp.]
MDETYIQNSIAQLKTDIFMDVRHRTLQKYTGEPVLDENQLFYLLMPFFNGENWRKEHREAAITVGIIYAALAAHDFIKETDATSKEQQLTVLAGDFYSGRYYEILAGSGNVALIRTLSKGIVERCEHQVKVYEKETRMIEQWITSLENIEAGLIRQFFRLYSFDAYCPIMEKSLVLFRLQHEWTSYRAGQKTRFNKAIATSISVDNDTFENIIRQHINARTNELKRLIEEAEFLQQDVKIILQARVDA